MTLTKYTRQAFVSLLAGLLCLVFFQDSFASLPQKRILILFPYESNSPGFISFDDSLRSTLTGMKEYQFEFYVECMDLTRFPNERYHDKLVELYREKFAGLKIDLIVAILRLSLDFLRDYGQNFFPETPVVYFEHDPRFFGDRTSMPNTALVKGELDMEDTLALALRLQPNVRHVFIVGGASKYDQSLDALARQALHRFEDQVQFHYLSGLPMDDLIHRVSSLPENSMLFYLSIFRDGSGKAFRSPDALALISRQANAPIYSISETYMGSGIVGGHLISYSAQGVRVAQAALRILAGEEPEDLETTEGSGNHYVFDARELERWGISEKNLPPGSEVRYRKFCIWEAYRWRIVGVVLILIFQTLLISALARSLRKQRQADRALRDAERKYRTVADFTHDWEYWSAPDGSLLYVSPSCERITGYSSGLFIEDPSLSREIVVPEDRGVWDAHHHDGQEELKFRQIQFRIRTRDGNIRWIEHACIPVIDEQGEFQGFRASNRDITERKNAELDAQRHREELAHITRIITMGELATSLAHEINQPLTAIRCNAEAAQRFLSSPSPDLGEVKQILDDIIDDDARVGEVIRRMRALVKKEAPRRDAVDLNETIWETIALVRSTSLLEGLNIRAELDNDLPTARGDQVQLQQVTLNLLMNAIEAMKDTPLGSRRLIVKTSLANDRTAMVAVTDSGKGIDENVMERLFEPFFTTKTEGLGMGLSISRSIIKAHGGRIWAENNREGGSTFSFTLPLNSGEQS